LSTLSRIESAPISKSGQPYMYKYIRQAESTSLKALVQQLEGL
ncbi:hypothetical protein KIPB_010839, partial [Kipferlia bialata]